MAVNEYATELASERIKRRLGLFNLIDILTTEDRYDDALVLASISTSGLCQSHCSILHKDAARLMARNQR